MRTRTSVLCILLSLTLLFPVTAYSSTLNSEAGNEVFSPNRLDDMFGFLLNEWIPSLSSGPNNPDARERLAWYVASGERDYGEQPEFWELSASHPTDRSGAGVVCVDEDLFIEREKLVHALELYDTLAAAGGNASRLAEGKSCVLYFLGLTTIAHEPESSGVTESEGNGGSQTDIEASESLETAALMADYYQRAEAANPNNAFFPIFLGVLKTGQDDMPAAISAFQRAGKCEYFEMPRLFQFRYMSRYLESLWNGERGFGKVKLKDKCALTGELLNEPIPDFVAIKRAVRSMIDYSKGKQNACEILSILNGVVCALGRDREENAISAVNCGILLSAVAGEALTIGRNSGNKNLELAAMAVKNDADSVKYIMKGFSFESSVLSESVEAIGKSLDESGYTPPPGSRLGDIETIRLHSTEQGYGQDDTDSDVPPLEILYEHPYLTERHLHKMHFSEIFLRLKDVNYTSPSNWYQNWLGMKMYLPLE